MKTRSIFDTLSTEDREHIISLCQNHTYQQVIQMIAKPRPEGLAVQTSVTALCRFYVRQHPVAHKIQIDAQLAEALDESFFEHGDTYYRGIIALLQQRIFTALTAGQSLDDITPSFRYLLHFRRDYLKLLQLRKQSFRPLDPVPKKYYDPNEEDDAEAAAPASSTETEKPALDSASSLSPAAPAPAVPQPEIPEIPAQNARNSAFSTNSTLSGKSSPSLERRTQPRENHA